MRGFISDQGKRFSSVLDIQEKETATMGSTRRVITSQIVLFKDALVFQSVDEESNNSDLIPAMRSVLTPASFDHDRTWPRV